MVTLCFEECVIDGEKTHAWAIVTPWKPFKGSDHFPTRAQMLSNCVDVLGETLLDPNLEFHKDIHENTKNLLISAARTRARLRSKARPRGRSLKDVLENGNHPLKVAVTENFYDRGHGEMSEIITALPENTIISLGSNDMRLLRRGE